MGRILLYATVWVAVSIPAAVLVGRFIAARSRGLEEAAHQRALAQYRVLDVKWLDGHREVPHTQRDLDVQVTDDA